MRTTKSMMNHIVQDQISNPLYRVSGLPSFSYINAQMIKVLPFPIQSGNNGQIRIKIQSERGCSNWLNVSPEQVEQIERILEGV